MDDRAPRARGSISQVELAQHGADVISYDALGDVRMLRNGGVAHAQHEEAQHARAVVLVGRHEPLLRRPGLN